MKTQTTASGGVGLGRGGRMSRQRKRDAVLRLLRGEDLEILSRALGVTAATLSGWQDTFLSAGKSSLATRSTDGEALETERLKAKLGEMLLERELHGFPDTRSRAAKPAFTCGHGRVASIRCLTNWGRYTRLYCSRGRPTLATEVSDGRRLGISRIEARRASA